MEFKVKNKIIEIKFDYRTMFKVDKQLATKNKETGASNNDGVGTLFKQHFKIVTVTGSLEGQFRNSGIWLTKALTG